MQMLKAVTRLPSILNPPDYVATKGETILSGDNAANGVIMVPALGRPFTLGMLYDKQKEELVPGVTLWHGKTLQNNTQTNPQPSAEFQVSTSDSIKSKTSLLDIKGSIKASLFGGMLEVGGSASYLNDNKQFHDQSRLTLQYKATTTNKQLMLLDCQAKKVDPNIKDLATHVVTGILYGANAFFVFDSERLDDSKVEEIQGQMQAVLKIFPSFTCEGDIDAKLSNEQRDLITKFSCKFHGDVVLKTNPATFKDAVNAYVELPSHIQGENEQNAVPQKVWLLPLKNLDSGAAEVKNGISFELVRKTEEALEDLKQVTMRCNNCLHDTREPNFNIFPEMHEMLARFHKYCGYYTTAIQALLAKHLPLIRAGKEDESAVKKYINGRETSPFCHAKINEWMAAKERESNVIMFCLEILRNIKVIPSQSELDKEIMSQDVDEAFCFVFTSLETSDPYLDQMARYVDPFEDRLPTTKGCEGKTGSPYTDTWYYQNEIISKMREKATKFSINAEKEKNDAPKKKFLVTAIPNSSYPGASLYHYQQGILISDDY